jgi:hypothetical protein
VVKPPTVTVLKNILLADSLFISTGELAIHVFVKATGKINNVMENK